MAISEQDKKICREIFTEITRKRNEMCLLWKKLDSIRNKYPEHEGLVPDFDNFMGRLQKT